MLCQTPAWDAVHRLRATPRASHRWDRSTLRGPPGPFRAGATLVVWRQPPRLGVYLHGEVRDGQETILRGCALCSRLRGRECHVPRSPVR